MSFDAVWEYRFYGWCTGVAEFAFELRLNRHSSGPLSRSLCRGHGSPVPTRFAVHMEAIGTFQTSRHVRSPVAIGGKADVLCSG